MAPKNKKKNGFYFYMKAVQEKEAAKGRHMSMKYLPDFAHPIWKNLSVAEREPYEEMARKFKNDSNLCGGKLASDGTRIQDNLQEQEDKIRQENEMKQLVKQFCSSDCTSTKNFMNIAPKKLFYFMSFNILCHTENDVYIPIEVGLIEYSILHGIHREYVKIFNPGAPPTGYAGIAKDNSEKKHEISLTDEVCCEKNMKLMYDEIKAFINPIGSDEYPPVFAEKSKIPVTAGCLNWLSDKAESENVVKVWDATCLLMELRAGIGNPLPSTSIATDLLSKTSFNYHPSTRCEFHELKDVHFCALSYSKRLCYLLSDAVCNLFNVQLTENHIPARAHEDKHYTVTVINDVSHSSNVNTVRLDKQSNYYQNNVKENKDPSTQVVNAPRQPASACIAEQMTRLHLNITAATVPGHGIGRGIRKK